MGVAGCCPHFHGPPLCHFLRPTDGQPPFTMPPCFVLCTCFSKPTHSTMTPKPKPHPPVLEKGVLVPAKKTNDGVQISRAQLMSLRRAVRRVDGMMGGRRGCRCRSFVRLTSLMTSLLSESHSHKRWTGPQWEKFDAAAATTQANAERAKVKDKVEEVSQGWKI